MSNSTVAVFGASGAIGRAICEWYRAHDAEVIGIGRSRCDGADAQSVSQWITWQGKEELESFATLAGRRFDAVVWAQGSNFNDDIYGFDLAAHAEMYATNVTYILVSLKILIDGGLLAPTARLCVISSIWQEIARQQKLSYSITKSALRGLVQSLSVDLGKSGHLINAVLPGPIDTPMTRANLSAEQLSRLEQSTVLKSLASLEDVCNLVGFLCSSNNTGITGQFIAADRGFSNARFV